MDYNKTLNLPKTEFPMRASLPQREPEFLKGWEKRKLYNQLMEHNEGKPLFVLHDGPPYANGSIHIGHALNKTLKDFIVRYKNMTGFKSPYVPGWDTHGLPTELAARKKAGITAESNISDLELRKICRDTALGFVDIQREGFKRLGVMAEWDHPYITLQKEFEQEQIKVFAQMASKGYIYKGLKPVYWCPDCKTALAEAEIEYAEDPCHSIYVKFKVTDDMGKLAALGAELDKTYFVIWTTTTWTLPANVAICVGPNYEYSVLKANGEYYVMATDLAPEAMADAGITDYETVGIIKGSELEYMKTAHPFIDRTSLVIVGDHVTLESGTGCVHTAPGHGVDDFVVCRKYPEIPIVVPVDENGVLTEEAGQFAGLTTDEANKPIAEHLEKLGALFALKKIKHQYPHCWRCHKPIIFRATSQWFCSVDDFKDAAVKAAEDVKWYPEWGKDRLQSMVVERADWCISRQRKWGVPIPVVYCKECGKEIIDDGIMKKKLILWMFGLTQVHHMPLFLKTEIISSGRQMFILRAQINTEDGSSHHFLPRLQQATEHHMSRLSLTAGLLTARAEKCRNLSATVSLRRRLLINTAQIFFAFGLQAQIITQIFVSAPKFLNKFRITTEKSETPQDIVSAIFMILTLIRIWLQTMNLRNLISTLL